ncbi:MAG: 3'(2'),5'-bisphosphate nucleotidase [Gammaproteobacteria bacterium RIFCSPHIGHO2_12_FULL_40_19]|nr:MAG: 3'(2'),5'-bisphosphate nucleotidase [Gammaproteobacteria bacterium RIFCSPHIGHO2_12_FULL_40_19]
MDYLSPVIEAAKKAGVALASYFHSGFTQQVTLKMDQTPVTQADVAANQIITEQLKQIDANIPILSEENDIPDYSVRQQWTRYWLIDPLDGTRGFIKRSPEFCVNIALIENHVPTLGVIYSPISQVCFFAIKNKGAFFIDPNDHVTHQMMTTKNKTALLRFLTGRFDQVLQLQDRKRELEKHFGAVIMMQMNSALKFPQIARGAADAYVRFGPTSEWDTAAGQCIVEEAGGAVVDFNGKPLQYNCKSSLINPSFIAMGDMSQCGRYLVGITSVASK